SAGTVRVRREADGGELPDRRPEQRVRQGGRPCRGDGLGDGLSGGDGGFRADAHDGHLVRALRRGPVQDGHTGCPYGRDLGRREEGEGEGEGQEGQGGQERSEGTQAGEGGQGGEGGGPAGGEEPREGAHPRQPAGAVQAGRTGRRVCAFARFFSARRAASVAS